MERIKLFEDFKEKKGMTADEIRSAVDAGKTVHWSNSTYTVVGPVNGKGDYLIKHQNGHAIGLTWSDGTTLNGRPEEFYIEE